MPAQSSVTEFALNGSPVTVAGGHEHLLAALRDELVLAVQGHVV